MKRLILAGLLSTVCAQTLAQANTSPPDDSLGNTGSIGSIGNTGNTGKALATSGVEPPAKAIARFCPPVASAPTRSSPEQLSGAFQAQLQQNLALLDSTADLCLDNPRFHAQRGLVLQLMGQSAAAVESLERALLLDPDQPGTQLDYALALRDAGDAASAQALLQQISLRADLPPGLQPVLQSQLTALPSPPENGWDQHLKVSLALGNDSNLNNATSEGQLTLTFPGGEISLPLADASRAQRGTAAMTAVQYQAVRPVNDQMWVLQAELRKRNTQQTDTGYQQLDLAAQWLQAPAARNQWQVRAGYSNLRFGGVDLLHSARAAVVHQWQLAWPGSGSICRPLAGLDTDIRRYPGTRQLDGTYRGLLFSVACDASEGGAAMPATGQPADFLFGNPYLSLPRFSLQLRTGKDNATSSQRPGGNYVSTDLRAAAYGRVLVPGVPGLDWLAEYSVQQQRDSTGYSPLLGNNALRQSTRQALRLELAHQLAPAVLGGARWFVSAELSGQVSNLNAFAAKGRSLYSGLRWDIF